MPRVRRSRSLADRAEVVDRLGLGDDVELAALVEQQRDVAHRLEAAAEPALGLAHALGHGPHLAVAGGEQHDDAVGLAQLVGAQHDARVAVEHRSTASRRRAAEARSRRWNSRTALERGAARRKSGHSTSVKTSSL